MNSKILFIGFFLLISSVFALTAINSCTNLSTSGETYQLGSSFNGNVSSCLNITTATGITIDGQNNQITSTYYTSGLFGSSIYTNNVISSNRSISVLNFITGQYAEPVFAISNASNFTNMIIRNIGHDNSTFANGGTYSQIGSEDAVMVFKSYYENNVYLFLPPANATPFQLSSIRLSNFSLSNISIDRDFGGGGSLYAMKTVMLFGAQTNQKPTIFNSNMVYDTISLNNISFQNINASGKLFYFAQLFGNQNESTNQTKFQVSNVQADNINFINMNDNAAGSVTNSFSKTSLIEVVSQFYPLLISNLTFTNVNFTNITNNNGVNIYDNPAIFRYHFPIFGDNPSGGFIGTQLNLNNLNVENISSDSTPAILLVNSASFPNSIQNFTFQNITVKQYKPFSVMAMYDFFGLGTPGNSQTSIQNYNFNVLYSTGKYLNSSFNITNDSSVFLLGNVDNGIQSSLGFAQTNIIDLNTSLNISWSHTTNPTMDLAISFPNPPTSVSKGLIKLRYFISGGTPTTAGSWVNYPDVPDSVYWQNITIDETNNLFIVHNQTAAGVGQFALGNVLYSLQIEAVKVALNSPSSGATVASSPTNVTLNWTCYGAFPSYFANVTFDGVLVGINNVSLNNTPQNLTVSAGIGSHLWDVKCFNETYYTNANQTFQVSSGGGGIPYNNTNTTTKNPPPSLPPNKDPLNILDWNQHTISDFIQSLSSQIAQASFTCYPVFQNNFNFFNIGLILDRIICEFKGLMALYLQNFPCLSGIVIILGLLIVVASKQTKKKEKVQFYVVIGAISAVLVIGFDLLLFFFVTGITFARDTATQTLFKNKGSGAA